MALNKFVFSVKLSTGVGRRTDQGGVLFNKDGTWYTLCANDFTDVSAKVVCKELGFKDGLSRSSQFGDLSQYNRLETHKVCQMFRLLVLKLHITNFQKVNQKV